MLNNHKKKNLYLKPAQFFTEGYAKSRAPILSHIQQTSQGITTVKVFNANESMKQIFMTKLDLHFIWITHQYHFKR